MSSSKITNHQRETWIRQIIKQVEEPFDFELKVLQRKLYEEIKKHCVEPKYKDAWDFLPNKYKPRTDEVRIFSGTNCIYRFELDEEQELRVPDFCITDKYNSYFVIQLQKSGKATYGDHSVYEALCNSLSTHSKLKENKVAQVKEELKKLFYSCTTVKRLVEAWPAILNLVPITELPMTTRALVPNTKKLNELMRPIVEFKAKEEKKVEA